MLKKHSRVHLSSVIPEDDRLPFESASKLLAQPMDVITNDRISGVSRLQLSRTYYVKVYTGRGEILRKLIGASRYQRELSNLNYFSALGLRIPAIAAFGQETSFGVVKKALLVTEEVSATRSLEQIIEAGSFYDRGVGYVRAVLAQLAHAVRILHEDGFFHRDLKTRNVLLQNAEDGPRLYFFDCPSGHHPVRFLMRRSITRDLAYLERGLRGHVRAVDLLYAFKQYRGCKTLSKQDKELARAILTYYGQRKMTRKRKERAEKRRGI